MNRTWVAVAAAVVLLAAVGLAVAVAPGGDSRDPAARYLLPWAAGSAYPVLQGIELTDPLTGACSSGCTTHRDEGMHLAVDFDLPEGTEVLAARGGTVALVQGSWRPDHCGGLAAPAAGAPDGFIVSPLIGNEANLVVIDHGDGTSALYLHLSEVAPAILAKAQTGEAVQTGELLGRSGRTGLTQCRPHLHFQVERTVRADWFTDSLPVSFSDPDVLDHTPDGVPVEGQTYVSANTPAP